MSSRNEATARLKINKLLEEAGWRFFDSDEGKANIQLEAGVKLTKQSLDELGDDFEKTSNGFIDYLLLDDEGFPLVVVEAKRESIHPLAAKEQARAYANKQKCRFVILTNGNTHYFWDIETGNPRVVTEFPSVESIEHRSEFEPNVDALVDEIVDEGYIARSQDPDFDKDPRWNDKNERSEYIRDRELRILRPYQVEAVQKLQEAAKQKQERFLFEMATGTGKTLTTAAVIRLFLRTGNAKRVLFLVDRIELEDQAEKAFKKVLGKDYIVKVYKRNRNSWKQASIVVSTIQTLLSGDRYREDFDPTDFELVVSDEAHRSIGGNSRAVFEYFNGFKLGLTATPKDYLKNLDPNVSTDDQRAYERRLLLDTYKTFGCESGDPTFRYSLLDGVKAGYLINPSVFDARTEITTQLLSDEGYSAIIEDEEMESEETFTHKDYEKKFFNAETNIAFCKTLIENALRDPISGEVGKTLVFCVSQAHARKVTEILNIIAHKLWPGKYNSDFAVQVTSSVKDAQGMTVNFANNNLNGHTRWLDGYKSAKTRICVTVGMMTTGYDCSDVLNLAMMRPIFSPQDFVQMKGRGTRKHRFSFESESGLQEVDKETFYLFDFFGNCEYFEDKFDYNQVLKLPTVKKGTVIIDDGEEKISVDEIDIAEPDQIETLEELEVPEEGMRIDRELYFNDFVTKIQSDPEAKSIYEQEGIEAVEDYVKHEILNKPKEFFTPAKLRKSLNLDIWVSLSEMLRKAFGEFESFPTKEEKIETEFKKLQDIEKLDALVVPAAKQFFSAYLQDDELREIVDKREYGRVATSRSLDPETLKTLAENGKLHVKIADYVHEYVPLKTFDVARKDKTRN